MTTQYRVQYLVSGMDGGAMSKEDVGKSLRRLGVRRRKRRRREIVWILLQLK